MVIDPAKKTQLSPYNVGSESKKRAARGCLHRGNGEYNKDQEQQYDDKEPLFITNAQMRDQKQQYRLHIGDASTPIYIEIFLAHHERLQLQR